MLQATNEAPIDRWLKDPQDDRQMSDDHLILWDRMIDLMREGDLSEATVLDYGCNTGGLLARLLERRPFARGKGVDIAAQAVADAAQKYGHLPLSFSTIDANESESHLYDVAISHEVIYLLPDIEAHARDMAKWLKPGGRYYAATGCHTANPRWPEWRTYIAETAKIAPQDYSPEDYVRAFEAAGFTAAVQAFKLDNFTPWTATDPLFTQVMDALDFYQNHKLLFRFTAPVAVEVAK